MDSKLAHGCEKQALLQPTGWDEDDFDLAVRSLGAFLQQLRQSQPPATQRKKNAHCAGSLRNIISGRSLCWLSLPAPSCWSPG